MTTPDYDPIEAFRLRELDRLHTIANQVVVEKSGGSEVIAKAASDPFDYACRLTSGEVIYFETLEVSGDWVLLTGMRDLRGFPPHSEYGPPGFPRGIEVQRRHIVWIADAPHGS